MESSVSAVSGSNYYPSRHYLKENLTVLLRYDNSCYLRTLLKLFKCSREGYLKHLPFLNHRPDVYDMRQVERTSGPG
ncbi:hypothetical protein TNIN_319431 [Trichonephila inaurata madagascariensis]|uniref:Uncharacterized protein n=1 Tax=Trichonephila inaurata madagascariensis TaxID=2747483 RepID=A0A8X6YKH4_9ARAC|nr:hypothetical protein TNIN_319431 [Trichonephila inaurata madagascariensis]